MMKVGKKFFAVCRGLCPISGIVTLMVAECQSPDWDVYMADWKARRGK
jgi:hypothetical protein